MFEKMKKKLTSAKTEFIEETLDDIPQKSFQSNSVIVEEVEEQIREARKTLNQYEDKTIGVLGINAAANKEEIEEPYNDIVDGNVMDDVTATNLPYIQEEQHYNRAIDDDFMELEEIDNSDKGELPFALTDIEDVAEGNIPIDDQLLLKQFEIEMQANTHRTSVTVVYDEHDSVKKRTYHFREERSDFEANYLMELDTYGYFTGKDERGSLVTINPAKCYTVEIHN